MWAPSTSASVIIITLSYLNFSISRSSPTFIPKAVIIERISLFSNILCKRAFSTFKIFPLRGIIAWNLLSLPCLAEPPAESPSTKNISLNLGSFSEQSANFPGSVPKLSPFFCLTKSRALRAASRAFKAEIDLDNIFLVTSGFSFKKLFKPSVAINETTPLTSLLPNLVLVCPSNWGFNSFTLISAVNPSLTSFPDRLFSFSFRENFLKLDTILLRA